jgi:hypothetical protein
MDIEEVEDWFVRVKGMSDGDLAVVYRFLLTEVEFRKMKFGNDEMDVQGETRRKYYRNPITGKVEEERW